jgi:hypothetical protein
VVAFIASILVTLALAALVIPFAKRRPPGTPLTWGEAMVAGVYVFAAMFWVYGMVPHLWLTWADNELNWRPDNIVYGPGDILQPQELGGPFPMTITFQVIRDLIAVGIYVLFLGLNIFFWAWWNDRAKRSAASERELTTSDYGRPLLRKG